MTWKTFGHTHAKRILDLQLERGIFPHAYLFLGPAFVGKKMLSLELAKEILNVEQGELLNHPDFIFFDCSPEAEILAIRQFMDRLSFKPFLANSKVAIINNAENLNTQSQNALLKTLEEPSSTILILISSGAMLSTIQSRCQILNFNRFSQQQMKNFCQEMKIYPTEEEQVKAFGLPGKIIATEIKVSGLDLWDKIKISSKAMKLAQIAKFAEKENSQLAEMFDIFAQAEILGLKKRPQNYIRANLLLEAKESLKKNFNKKLVLQKLFLSLN